MNNENEGSEGVDLGKATYEDLEYQVTNLQEANLKAFFEKQELNDIKYELEDQIRQLERDLRLSQSQNRFLSDQLINLIEILARKAQLRTEKGNV